MYAYIYIHMKRELHQNTANLIDDSPDFVDIGAQTTVDRKKRAARMKIET